MMPAGIYEWHEVACISDAALAQARVPLRLPVFRELPVPVLCRVLITPPRHDPVRCVTAYGFWAPIGDEHVE